MEYHNIVYTQTKSKPIIIKFRIYSLVMSNLELINEKTGVNPFRLHVNGLSKERITVDE